MQEQLEVGDLVRLNSGSPTMTVSNIDQPRGDETCRPIWCIWIHEGARQVGRFYEPMLTYWHGTIH